MTAEIGGQQLLIKEHGILRLNGINSRQIMSMLHRRHEKDLVVPECKNGETWGARDLLKLDAWVLCRTYSPLTTIGYEIKCSRQDFEQDQKWTKYLDLCHMFYFVCPAGLIRATDLPSNIGIIWASRDKLHIKHKAERLQPNIEKQNRLLIYILMARTIIVANWMDKGEPEKDRLQVVKETIDRAKERKELAYFVKSHIREKEIDLNNRERSVLDFQSRLAKLGITWDAEKGDWNDTMRVNKEIDALKNAIDLWTLRGMRDTGQKLVELVNTLEKHYEANR